MPDFWMLESALSRTLRAACPYRRFVSIARELMPSAMQLAMGGGEFPHLAERRIGAAFGLGMGDFSATGVLATGYFRATHPRLAPHFGPYGQRKSARGRISPSCQNSDVRNPIAAPSDIL